MAKAKILVVDDEEDILRLVEYNLQQNGYQAICAATGEEALHAARTEQPGLIILDLMLPGMDGLEVCSTLKNDPPTSAIPILMLTAKGEESDIVAGLELGADDYVTKPFNPRVLIARVRALLRRAVAEVVPETATIRRGDVVIDPTRREVLAKGRPVDLTFTEFGILRFLAARPGWVFTRNQIIDEIRGSDYPVTDRSVDVQVAGLRKKLGACGKSIETVRGVGYRYKE